MVAVVPVPGSAAPVSEVQAPQVSSASGQALFVSVQARYWTS